MTEAHAPAHLAPANSRLQRFARLVMPKQRHPVVRTTWFVLVAIVGLAVVVLGVFPVRTYLNQRAAEQKSAQRLSVIQAENKRMEERLNALANGDEIERIAREQYNMVRPGEKAYALLPPPVPADLPDTWPFNVARKVLQAQGAG